MTRLVWEINAARDERGRLRRDLQHATAQMKRLVARLRSAFAADLLGARAAWFGARAPVSRGAGEPGSAAPGGREAEAEREDVLREPAEERRHIEAAGPEAGAEREDVLREAAEERRHIEAAGPEAGAEREDVLREAAEERRRVEAERGVRAEAKPGRRARRRQRSR
jgi:hypothetical protein